MTEEEAKLGDVWEGPKGQRWILTSVFPAQRIHVWTPIPKGEDELGLGRRYPPAPSPHGTHSEPARPSRVLASSGAEGAGVDPRQRIRIL